MFAVLTVAAFFVASAESFTVNFYHGELLSGEWDYFLTAKNGDQTIVNNQRMELAGFVTIDDREFPYFSYTFEAEEAPESVKFFYKRFANEPHTSAEFEFVEGKLYNFGNSSDVKLADLSTSAPVKKQLLIVDKLGWGENIAIHAWDNDNNGGDITLWDDSHTVKATDKYYLDQDGKYYSVYKFEYYFTGEIDEIIYKLKGSSAQISTTKLQHGKLIVLGPTLSAAYVDMPEKFYSGSEHTVYFADLYGWGSGWADKYMHAQVFLGKNADGSEIVNGTWSNANQLMSKTGKYVQIGGSDADYYPVYSYTFTSVQDPTEVHFYTTATTNPILETARADYSEGAIYYLIGNSQKEQIDILNAELTDEEDVPESEYIIYFVDRNQAGSANTKVHVWNGLAPLHESANDDSMTDYAYVKDGNGYTPVYKYTFKFRGTPTNINFTQGNAYSPDYVFLNNRYYYSDASSIASNLDLTFEKEYTIYFADKFGWGGYTYLAIVGDNGNLADEVMTYTDKYVKLGETDSDYYPVFKRTFSYIGEPQRLYFHYKENNFPSEGANEAAFVDQKIYFASAEGDKQDMTTVDLEGNPFLAFEEMPEVEHTVYLVDMTSYGAHNTKVHVWNGGEAVKDWSADDNMEPFGLTTIDGTAYPVYVYNFKWRGAPTKIIFRLKTQTTNLHYYEGKYYIYNGGALPTVMDDVEVSENIKYTVYFIDLNGWGADRTLVHCWNNNGAQYEWLDNKPMEPTGRYVKFGEGDDDYYPVYKYDIYFEGTPSNVIFHKQGASIKTGDLNFADNQVYYLNTTVENSSYCQFDELETVGIEDVPVVEHTVYLVDKRYNGSPAPNIHVFGTTGDVRDWDHSDAMEEFGRTTIDGTNYPVFRYTFKYQGKPTGVIFKYTWNTGDLEYKEGYYYTTEGPKYATLTVDEFPEYTVYFADRALWGTDNVRVHIWKKDGPDNTAWNNDPYATDTEKYVVLNGNAYRLFSYTFRWTHTEDPDMIIWKNGSASNQTADDKFENGKVYMFSGQKKSAEVNELGELYTYDEVWPDYHKTYYFADTDYWGADNTTIHLWGAYGESSDWYDDLKVEDTGKWIKVNDLWCPLYKLETMYQDGANINVHNVAWTRQIGDRPSENGKVYYYAGPSIIEDAIELPEDLHDAIPADEPADERWIYVNLGANQIYRGLWGEPHAKFFRREIGQMPTKEYYEGILPNPHVEEEKEEYASQVMEYVRDGFYKIKCDDINKYNEVVFYYSWKKENVEDFYNGLAFPITFGSDCGNDPSTWGTYVFDIGLNCMHQSYLREDTYNSVWVENPDVLYFMGNNAFDENASPNGDINPLIGKRIDKDEDVYIVPMGTMKPDKVVLFKVSMFDVKAISEMEGKVNGKNYHYQRGFATCNPGTIGMAFPGNRLTGPWYDAHIVDPDSRNGSKMTRTFVNETVRINNYCQYPWRIEVGHGGVKENQDYWLVVDLHADDINHNSLTLIEFDPQPELKITDGSIHTEPLSLADAMMLHDSDLLQGSTDNGPVYFDKVNVYAIDATLSQQGLNMLNPYEETVEVEDEDGKVTTETRTVEAPYSVEYILFMEYGEDDLKDRIPVSKLNVPTDVKDVAVNISNLVYDKDVEYYLRAVYYDKVNERHFCSHYMPVKPAAVVPDLIAPVNQALNTQLIPYTAKQRDGEQSVIIGGAVTFDFPRVTTEEGMEIQYAYFPDYIVTDIVLNDNEHISSPSQLIHRDHFAAQRYGNHLGIMAEGDKLPWTPYTDSADEYQSHHNWSNYIYDEQHLPLFIDQIDSTGVGATDIDAKVEVKFSAVYPFLINTVEVDGVAQVSDVTKKARVVSNNAAIYPVWKSNTATALLNDRVTISGIDEIGINGEDADGSAMDSSAATVEYYTISGQRLNGAPTAAGIYLRRCGLKTQKVIVK